MEEKIYDVFISYSSVDQKVAEGLCHFLEQNKIRCFVSYRDIPIGTTWQGQIVSAIERSKTMLVVFSDSYNISKETDREITQAVLSGLTIFPFRLCDSRYIQLKAYYLGPLNWIDAFPEPEKSFSNIAIRIAAQLDNLHHEELESHRHNESNITPHKDTNFKIFQIKDVDFKMIKVDGGTFDMGAEDESPIHKVTLSDYYIAETPVTQGLWSAVMGNDPSYFKGKNRPVENVSWVDCHNFINELNSLAGVEMRLPTEAEWEYAARGGKYNKGCTYSGGNDIDQVAWWSGNSSGKSHTVKTKEANELGIYDMSGNVWEWCHDNYKEYSNNPVNNPQGPVKEGFKVQRGGCWYGRWFANMDSCKVTYRCYDQKTYKSERIGFRLAMSVPGTQSPIKDKKLPEVFKISLADSDVYMLLSANKKYYIGNILDKNAEFKWLSFNSGLNVGDIMITGATITTLIVAPIITILGTILYAIFKKDKGSENIVIDENFCKAISRDYKFSIPNETELKCVSDSEKSHCIVLRLNENPNLKELLA